MSTQSLGDGYSRGEYLRDIKLLLVASRVYASQEEALKVPELTRRLAVLSSSELLDLLVEAKRAGLI